MLYFYKGFRIKQFQSAEEWNKFFNFLHDYLLEMSYCAKFEFQK